LKNLICSLVLGLILISLVGCHDNNPPTPNVVTYSVESKNDSAFGGKITPATINVNSGSSVVFTITPDFGYDVKELKVNGTVVTLISKTNYTLSNITSDTKVVVTFKKGLKYYLTQKSWIYDSALVYKTNVKYSKYIETSRIGYVFLANGDLNSSMNGDSYNYAGKWSVDESKNPVTMVMIGFNDEFIRVDGNIMILNVLNDGFVTDGSAVKVLEYYSHH